MKVSFNQLKQLLPELKASPKEVGEVLTRLGFLADGLEEKGGFRRHDTIISLEVRQNRADCLGVIGIAKELAAYYGLRLNEPAGFASGLPSVEQPSALNIKVRSDDVRRVLAVKIENLTNGSSPEWLKDYLENLGVNSVNLLVDISNYIMLTTGYPPHLFDADKIGTGLVWENNREKIAMETFDGTQVNLLGGELVISNGKEPLALAGLIGAKTAGVTLETKNIIAEIANYNPSQIRSDSRKLRIFTEAGSRLDKNISPSGIDKAMNLMIRQITELAGGVIKGVYGHYSEPVGPITIPFDLNLPTRIAGIPIDEATAVEILNRLGCEITGEGSNRLVSLPMERTDLTLAEDLAEEVIRLYGYEKIVATKTPALDFTPDITPPVIVLAEALRDRLVALGFDEILSCPLVKNEDNDSVKTGTATAITTQNPINEGYPQLRLSLIPGLINQRDEFWKLNVAYATLFEIGKVFAQERGRYEEQESLAVLVNWRQGASAPEETVLLPTTFREFRATFEKVLRSIGLDELSYTEATITPGLALPKNCFQIMTGRDSLGLIYKLKENQAGATYVAQINLTKLVGLIYKEPAATELETKLVSLDANVILKGLAELDGYLARLSGQLPEDNIWSLNAIDQFKTSDGIRYTLRVVYHGLSDQEAKTKHAKIFG
ncbi:MAG TPA: phenylalanine--tRNA ligase subunit beta [Candidatus Saccharimonadales bacterium]|nr:phenylalanine--tRNA ligase subunit beta [Candidatus Saccharimonadales bacterium]